MKRLASRSTWWHTLPHKSTYAVNAAERKGQPWNHAGIDVHKKDSQICLLAEGGELIERRIRTELARFAAVLGDRPRVESGTSGGPVVTREGKLLGIVSTAGGAVEERTRSGTIARACTPQHGSGSFARWYRVPSQGSWTRRSRQADERLASRGDDRGRLDVSGDLARGPSSGGSASV